MGSESAQERAMPVVRPRRSSLVLVSFFFLASTSAGCETNNVSLVIEANILPEPQDTSCILNPQGTPLTYGRFNIDIDFDRPYEVFPLYANQLRAPHNSISADNRGIHVTGAEVTLYDEAGSELNLGLPNPFFVLTSTFVPTQGKAVGEVPVVPEAYRDALRAASFHGRTLLVGLSPVAETTGDVTVDTEEWFWPIELCGGTCLLVCPMAMGAGSTDIVCTPGQDTTTPDPRGCS